jgi:hypothetical protein
MRAAVTGSFSAFNTSELVVAMSARATGGVAYVLSHGVASPASGLRAVTSPPCVKAEVR